MAKTATCRSKEHRDRTKLNPVLHQKEKQKERERWMTRSVKMKTVKLTATQEKEKKEKERLRKAKWRANKKNAKLNMVSSPSYSTSSALGKAVNKVSRNLPKEPSKKVTVIAKVLHSLSPKKQVSLLSQCTVLKRCSLFAERKQRNDALSIDIIENVKSFFEREDISRMLPGIKDSIIQEGMQERKQKRVLLMTVKEAYSIYCDEYENVAVGMTKFQMLRPKHVILSSQKDQEVCYCIYHENIELIVEGLLKNLHNIEFPKLKELCDLTLCDEDNQTLDCIDRLCSSCGVRDVETIFEGINFKDNVTYYQWSNVEGRTKKLPITCSIAEAIEVLKLQLAPFARHIYNIKRQYKELQKLKEDLCEGELIIIEDFAENYAIRQQNEIMSAHWHSEQVSIFTAVIYYKDDVNLEHFSYAVVSEDLVHDKGAVFSANKAILNDIKQKLVFPVKYVHYWSDGAGSQFKNRFNLGNLVHHEDDFGCKADWSFFETAHGKGPADGIGAIVKRSVWTKVLQNKAIINSAEEFFELAKLLNKKITILFVSSSENETQRQALIPRWSQMRKPIISTHKLHYVKPEHLELKIANNSPFTVDETNDSYFSIHPVYSASSQLKSTSNCLSKPAVGNFVVAEVSTLNSKVPTRIFVAQICAIEHDNAELSFLKKLDSTNKCFSFPDHEDRSWAHFSQITVLPEPVFDDRRYKYIFSKPIDNVYA